MKKHLLFVISQLFKGGAETSLVNLLANIDYQRFEVDLLILNQVPSDKAISLVDQVPRQVNICDAYARNQKRSVISRIKGRFINTAKQKGAYYLPALHFVRGKSYDWAFHIGEWSPPAFVAEEVRASVKAAWIHNDLSIAEYFDHGTYFYYHDCLDCYIFVSQNSMDASLAAYPFLRGKSVCVYNINDVAGIKSKAEAPLDEPCFKSGLPVLVTCANIRTQKNHLRQVQVMAALKKRGVDLIWLNLGDITDAALTAKVGAAAKKEGLEGRFLLLGAKENPYNYIKNADAVTVLSDYESWSMVITEAKIIGTPVISTQTSGALEQLEHGVSGIFTDFSITDIADKIEGYLSDRALREKIKGGLTGFDNTGDILQSFYKLVEGWPLAKGRKTGPGALLYIIDDINYLGGAHIATKLQIQHFLRLGTEIAVFSNSIPNTKVRVELHGASFLSWRDLPEDVVYNRRLIDCLLDRGLPGELRAVKINAVRAQLRKDMAFFENGIMPCLSKLFSRYETVCVMSEGSNFRKYAANSSCKNKVQWMHIDYAVWKDTSQWTQQITRDDGELYKSFDKIVLLSEKIKNDFAALYPHLRDKLIINRNLIPADEIKEKSLTKELLEKLPHFVTVGRIDPQKAYDRLFTVLIKLFEDGYRFYWTIVGDGYEFSRIHDIFHKSSLNPYVHFTGALANPFPTVKEADVFALLSNFEGLPNTIYEAFILGVPVIATKTGGVEDQVTPGVNGWLVENNEDAIYLGLKHVISNPGEIRAMKENLADYRYDNQSVVDIAESIMLK